MPPDLHGASGTEMAFWACAICGTVFFFLRAAAMAFGGFGADDSDASGGHADAGAQPGHDVGHTDGHSSSDAAFKLVSIHSLTGFVMMFGWIGLAAYRQFRLGSLLSIAVAGLAGLATMYVTALLFKAMRQLTAQGSCFRVDDVVGQDAVVYVRIPADGRGQIEIVCEGVKRYLDAVSDDSIEIQSFQAVRITRSMDAKTVGVRRKE